MLLGQGGVVRGRDRTAAIVDGKVDDDVLWRRRVTKKKHGASQALYHMHRLN